MSLFNNVLVKCVQFMPKWVVKIFANKYIAGENLSDAVRVVNELNSKGIHATIDLLGEAVSNKDESAIDKEKCLEILQAINENNLSANLSIKPTQLGLQIDEDFCYHQVEDLVKMAEKINNFVRIDMEDSSTTDATIRLFNRLKKNYSKVGVVVQSYLKRTYSDVAELNQNGTNYRLCKGIYIEPKEIAYKDYQKVRDNFLDVLRMMLKNGNYVGIATHDDFLINGALKLINEMKIPNDKFEFQMLLGVKEKLWEQLNKDGYKVRIYVPFGKEWYRYSLRRLKENPNIARHMFFNLFRLN